MKKWLLALAAAGLLAACTDGAMETEQQDELGGFEEYEILSDNIDLSAHEAEVETDNSNSRVILFEDSEGNKTYKSVFVKDEQHLKIIQLDDDGVIYNDYLE